MSEYVPFSELLAVSLNKDLSGAWYATVKERDEKSGRIRTRCAFLAGGELQFFPSEGELPIVEYR